MIGRHGIAGLVLAAGESRRMGRDKPLLAYRGRTFLETILASLAEAGILRTAVVLGHHAERIRATVNLDAAEVVLNPDYRLGQTSSLQAGLRALAHPDLGAVVLCLVDYPTVSADVIRALVGAFRESGAPLVIPTFESRRGHPVVMGRALFPELLALAPDQGANSVVRGYGESVRLVEVLDPGILVDVDDPDSYQRLLSSQKQTQD